MNCTELDDKHCFHGHKVKLTDDQREQLYIKFCQVNGFAVSGNQLMFNPPSYAVEQLCCKCGYLEQVHGPYRTDL